MVAKIMPKILGSSCKICKKNTNSSYGKEEFTDREIMKKDFAVTVKFDDFDVDRQCKHNFSSRSKPCKKTQEEYICSRIIRDASGQRDCSKPSDFRGTIQLEDNVNRKENQCCCCEKKRKFHKNLERHHCKDERNDQEEFGGGIDCRRCCKKVYFAEMQFASGAVYHKICFSCLCCRKPLESLTYQEQDGEIFCKQCYTRHFGPQGYGYGLGAGTLQTTL